ncbi:hypothetical protein ABB37_06676 [Leptomonas pyrrhocoris]|uniref:Uncharacterized protein n=1 Tax=Leptomonas pyrrhocoris TaxID=157538 RepID=A0A0M9FX54_LEPPY|nr:hypothetical protein ABB37_06676 [Leptomonas pyrrhocoris]XP_015656324.1 hypothetical protein ABB37_06676 [Leptomonas pyrrhocoris]KPA77884.1 hypothetical protein ABB37_06676 [Leptomonas pyrrhocoris]KPA77885.1 hypothetical protein ABB37_06676 [Leptomonas pyrrhocoris]|eukprot:XP_015656323.1 hypothetical protein ABB37_06676 [Leptomonas pyrrhocoris]
MTKAKGLYITVDASAPVLILPKGLHLSAQETALAVSLGRVRFHARPLTETEKQRRLTAAAAVTDRPTLPTPTKPSLSDAERSCGAPARAAAAEESLFYYPHKASFSKFYLELTTVEKAMRLPQQGFLLIPEVSIAADVLQRIDDRNTTREAFVLRLKVPTLRVACSLHQVYLITSLVDAWISHLGSGKPNEPAVKDGATSRSPSAALSAELHRSRAVSEAMEVHAEGGGDHGEPAKESKAKPKSADGGASPTPGSSPTFSSPASTAPARAAASGGDPPVMRLELLVLRLGLDVYDDDASTLHVSPLPVYRVECVSAEFIFAVRTHHKKMVLWLKEPHIVAAHDADRPILSCGGVRVDVLILEGETPTGVAVSVDAALNLCVGTACVEMLETTMDVVNLILSAVNSKDPANDTPDLDWSFLTAAAGKGELVGSASGVARIDATMGSSHNRLSDLAYQMNMVRQQNAMPNRHVADVFVRVHGPATVTLLNRAPSEAEDSAFASAAVSDVELRLSKFAATMDLSGRVGAVSASVLASSGLAEENRTLLAYTPASSHPRATSTVEEEGEDSGSSVPTGAANTAKPAPPPIHVRGHSFSAPGPRAGGERGESSSALPRSPDTADADSSGHITFSFRKSRPVMPLFQEVGGKRVLANPQELRYSSALELVVGSSTITLDLNTVMVFKTYFVSGLFSRFSRLSDRPLYNGRAPPPAREGPRLLMSFRVVVRDTVVVLPVDPRKANTHRFCAALGNLVLENSLNTAECKETMNISFGELGFWREEPVSSPGDTTDGTDSKDNGQHQRRTMLHSALLPKPTYVEMAVRLPLDLLSDDAPHIDIRSEDVSLELRETDLVQLVTLLRQNLTRTDQTAISQFTVEAPKPSRQVVVGQDGQARLVMQSHTNASGAWEGHDSSSALANPAGPVSTSFAVSAVARVTHRCSEELYISLRLGRISTLLSDGRSEATTGNSAVTSTVSRFQLQSSGLAMTAALPSNHIGVRWKSLQLDDVRDNSSSALLWCEAGSLQLADSLTTQSILMSDFGVRRSALHSVDPDEWMMGSLTSSSSHQQGSSIGDTKQGGAHVNNNNNDSDDDEPEWFPPPDVRAEPKKRHSPTTARPGANTELLSISVMSADFTLRRLAVSDQWLALYDATCNETVAAAWTAPQTGMLAMKAPATTTTNTTKGREEGGGAGATESAAKNSGMRICVTTPNVVIPFLNSLRETLIEANIAAVLVDVVRLPSASTQVAVKVRELNVVDAVSGEEIIYRRRPTSTAAAAATTAVAATRTSANCGASLPAGSPLSAGAETGGAGGGGSAGLSQTVSLAVAPATQRDWEEGWEDVDAPFSPLLGTKAGGTGAHGPTRAAAGGGMDNNGDEAGAPLGRAAASPTASDAPEVLQFTFKADPAANTNQIQLGIGALHALVSMPIIHGLVDYFTSPCEPVAKIGSLGVMREQRARMAAAAQQMANNSHLVLHVLWRRPCIILAADGLHLTQRRSSNIEMRLGVMRAAVHLKSSASTLSVVVKVQEYSILSLLKRSSLRFAFQSIAGAETIDFNMERTTAQFHPTEVEGLILLGQRNILLPREVYYYGRYEKTSSPAASPVAQTSPPPAAAVAAVGAAPPSPSSSSSSPPPPPPPVRIIQVHIDGLLVAIHDAAGRNTHTLSLASLDAFVAADGSAKVLVPSFGMLDLSTNRYLVQSCTKSLSHTASLNASVVPALASFAQHNTTIGSSPEGSLKASIAGGNAVRFHFDSNERVGNVHIGAILVTVIPRSIGSLANSFLSVQIPATPAAPVPATNTATTAAVTVNARSSSAGSAVADGEKAVPAPAPPAATNTNAKPFTLKTTLTECRVQFCQEEREVALLRLSRIGCNSVSHPDGTNELSVTLGNLFMVDTVSTSTNFRTFIYPYKDEKEGERVAEEEEEEEEEDTDSGEDAASISIPADAAAATTTSPTLADAVVEGARAVNTTVEAEDKRKLSISSEHAPEVDRESLVVYQVRSLPCSRRKGPHKTTTSDASSHRPRYTKQMRCRIKSLSFIFVPNVVHAVMDAVREVQTHVSEGNRSKAYHYVSDRAAKSVQRKAPEEALTEVDIVVHRPEILLVDKPTATCGMQLSPGRIVVKSRLVVPRRSNAGAAAAATSTSTEVVHSKAEGDLALQAHEVFHVQVHKLGMLLQEVNCFQQECSIIVEYQRSLAASVQREASAVRSANATTTAGAVPVAPGLGGAANTTSTSTGRATSTTNDTETSEQNSLLKLDIPVLSMNFTQRQTDFAMDVLGALMKGTPMDRTVRTVEEGSTAAGSGAASPATEGSGNRRNTGAGSPAVVAGVGAVAGSPNNAYLSTVAFGGNTSYGAEGQPKQQRHLYDASATVPVTAFSIDAHVGMLQADLADLFRLHVDEVRVQSTEGSTTGKTIDARIGSMFIQHVGAEVDAESGVEASRARSGGTSGLGTAGSSSPPGGPSPALKTARIQELVDLLVLTKLHVRYVQPQPSIEVQTASSMTESTIIVSAGAFNVAVSPTILFDTRELLYLPFCYKVLRVPIDPLPVLNLVDATTTLDGDTVLDGKHVLLTASRTRCNYVLDLNQHKLVLTGAPSGQVVLCEGCELTITNGTICIPGMYTIGSYVSFAPCTALFTTESCKFEKEFLNVGNSAFSDSIIGQPSFAPPPAIASNRSGKGGSAPSPLNTARSSDASTVETLAATTAPRAEVAEDGVIELRDRTVRVIADFYCDDIQLQMLSEEVVDLSVSLRMQSHMKFVQDWENEQAARRTVSVQMISVRSGEDEAHILLPTDMVMNVTGVDSVSVSLILDSMEFCTRTTLLRSLVELAKDFGAAFIEETTVSRQKPRIEYETASLDALYPVLEAGECQHCGRDVAYLALASDKPGILCYKCCTGYDSLPAIDFRVEVPLVDGILFGSTGDMAHIYMRNVLLSVDPAMDVQLTLRMFLDGFSNAAAVWEPAIEQFDATVTGSVSTHDYRIRMDRLDCVLSPQNIRLLSNMIADYGAATALQKQLRKRFRRQKQQRTQQVAPNQGVPMYVNAGLLEEVARVELQEEEMTLAADSAEQNVSIFHPIGVAATSPPYPSLNGINAAALTNTSIFDILSSTNRRLLSGAMALASGEADKADADAVAVPPKRGYAHVYVTNHCNVPLLADGRRVNPRGGTLRFIAKDRMVKINRVVKPEDEVPEETDYATSISNPPLYVQTKYMVLETRVLLGQDDGSRFLRRTVTMKVYPLHTSHTIICVENRLHCGLASIGNYAPIKPGERFYLAPNTDLDTAMLVQPVHTPDRVEYEAGRAAGEAVEFCPTSTSMHDVLCGVPMVLVCKAKGYADKMMTVKVYARQEEMRGGVPTFTITVEPRFRLRNKLPYRLIVNVLPDPHGDLARGRTPARPVPPLVSTVLEVRQGADLALNTYRLDQVVFLLEVRQRRPPQAVCDYNNTTGSAPTASTPPASAPRGKSAEEEEVFSTLVPTAISEDSPYISLRSQLRRELLIHAVYVPSKGSVIFTTPFVLLNHSPLSLTLRECKPDGSNKLYDAEPNFSVLHPEMNASVAATPMDIRKGENFFVNVYHEQYRGTCVPLHAQQRGVVILQDTTAPKAAKSKAFSSCSGGSKKRSDSGSTAATAKVGPTVIHLAYSAQVDPCGSLLVTFAPRWVVVNRSHLPLYVAPATYNGITAEEASAVATTAVVASQQKECDGAKAAEAAACPPASPTQQQQKMDDIKSALQEMVAENSVVFLSDAPTQVIALPPYSATPFYETPLCAPEVGYNIHVLQSPLAPLYGTPVGIESIHSELIVAYKPPADTRRSQGGSSGSTRGDNDRKDTSADRDRFLEVSLVVRGSYTYVVLEPPERVPYLLLNRTNYLIEVRDTATKSKGRLMARVQPGCGTDLILDTSVTTLTQVRLFNADGSKVVYEVEFDVSRPMTRREMSAAVSSPVGVTYSLGYGGFGQQIIDLSPAKATLQSAYTSVAAPPTPINVLLNLGVATLSVVMPNRDVLFCAVTDIRFSWDRQTDREVMKFSMENFQVDNQTEVSPRYDSCILSLRTSNCFAAASGYVERVLVPAKGLICLNEVRLDFVPLALRVSDTLLVACAGFVQAVRSGSDAPVEVSNQSMISGSTSTVDLQEAAAAPRERCPTAAKLYADAPVQIDMWAAKLTLERFIINPIIVRVWLTRDVEGHDFFRENINSKDAALLSMLVSSCEDVTVAAPGIVTAKQTSRLGVFAEWVLKTYQDGLLSQLKGLLLQYASSLPMIGAPLKLASGFGNGAVRLFRDPIEGLSTSPSAFAQGIARGSAGFAQEFAGGGLGAFSNFTDSWSRLLSMGGGVSEKERRRQNTLSGLASGLLGIIQRPMEGAAESGATGFLKGTAHGLVGVVANPMSGLLSDVSRATGTLGKLVTDTYIPKTHRLRPIRDFYANGGVAPWRSLVSVYQYQRLKTSTQTFSGDQLLSSVDGPEWYPSKREGATYGRNKLPIPEERWTLDRYHTNFEGWTYSTKYYGLYTERQTPQVRVRRMRWTALVRPLPYSRVAFYLRVAPGMETQRRRTASLFASPTLTPQETNIPFTSPGQLQAITVEQAKARKKRFLDLPGIHHGRHGSSSGSFGRSRSRSRSANGAGSPHKKSHGSSEYSVEEEYANQKSSLHQRMRNLTATGRHVGVSTETLKGTVNMPGDEEDDPVTGGHTSVSMYSVEGGSAAGSLGAAPAASAAGAGGTIKLSRSTADLQAPDAPRNRQKQKKHQHSRSASDLEAVSGSSSGASQDEGKTKKGGVSKQDKKKAEAIGAATRDSSTEAAGSKLPQPGAARSVRSNSGRVVTADATAGLANVPGASPTFASRTSGTAAGPLPTTIVEIYEYEQRVALVGWGKRYLPSECPGWQDTHGNEVPSRQDIRAPAGWTWTTDWTIVGGDSAGWTMMNEQKNLRRRMWQRRLVKQPQAQSPSS